MMANELDHDWTEKPKRRRLAGTLTIRLPKPTEPANDRQDKEPVE